MSQLAEVQALVAHALRDDRELDALAPLLRGGTYPLQRFAIHRRNYTTSLMRALVERFPATVWLIGSDAISAAARTFVEHQPPDRPCIAEYGEQFPAHLAKVCEAAGLAYLEQFAQLEWHLGQLALETDESEVRLLRLDWALDELIQIFLTDQVPDRFVLSPGPVFLELRGTRGELQMTRLDEAEFLIRQAAPIEGKRDFRA